MANTRRRGLFRDNCLAAKQRLLSGFWVGSREQSVPVRKLKIEKEDEIYSRVVSAIRCGQSPLSQVLDREHMGTLGSVERERYVFEISKRVQECIQRFNCEVEIVNL